MGDAKVWKFGTGWAGITARGKRIFGETKSSAQSKAGVKTKAAPKRSSSGGKGAKKKVKNNRVLGNLGLLGALEAVAANVVGTYVARMYIPEDLRAASVAKILYGAQGHVFNRRGKQFLSIGVIDFVTDFVLDWLETGAPPSILAAAAAQGKVSVKRGFKVNGIIPKMTYARHAWKGESRAKFKARKARARI